MGAASGSIGRLAAVAVLKTNDVVDQREKTMYRR